MRALAGLLCGVLLFSSVVATARAQPADSSWLDTELIGALDASGLLDEWRSTSLTRSSLDFVAVEGRRYSERRAEFIDLLNREQAAVAKWASTAADRTLTEQKLRSLVENETEARAYVAELDLAIERAVTAKSRVQAEIEATAVTRTEIAVTRYMGGRLATELQSIRDSEPVANEFSRSTILEATDASYSDYLKQLYEEHDRLEADIEQRIDSRDQTISALIEIGSRQLLATETITSLGGEVATLESGSGDLLGQATDMLKELHQLRVAADVPQLGFSLIAFDAYIAAQDDMEGASPECQVDWATIAGIGHIESIHGTIGGRYITANGNLSSSLLGVLLDGGEDGSGNGFLTVVDSDNGALDGSAEYDRALGPMQFLPSTWRISGVDGNNDGVKDPQNIYDAAAGAARYLCVVGREIESADMSDRLRGYNDSSSYVNKVLANAEDMRMITVGMDALFD